MFNVKPNTKFEKLEAEGYTKFPFFSISSGLFKYV